MNIGNTSKILAIIQLEGEWQKLVSSSSIRALRNFNSRILVHIDLLQHGLGLESGADAIRVAQAITLLHGMRKKINQKIIEITTHREQSSHYFAFGSNT